MCDNTVAEGKRGGFPTGGVILLMGIGEEC
jgi:hypothetical protein